MFRLQKGHTFFGVKKAISNGIFTLLIKNNETSNIHVLESKLKWETLKPTYTHSKC